VSTAGIRIGKLVEKTGVTRATIHHYVKEGLLPEPVKSSRNMALYHPDCVERVTLIKSLQKTYRRSLSEVKNLLDDADQHEGLRRLRAALEADESAQPPELRSDRPRNPITRADLLSRTGLGPKDLDELVKLVVVTPDKDGKFTPMDVDIVDALARLSEAGFTEDAGFQAQDAVVYVEAMRDLLAKEAQIFLARAGAAGSPDQLVEMARKGIERVTPLILAIRRKQLHELIGGIPTPPSRKKTKG